MTSLRFHPFLLASSFTLLAAVLLTCTSASAAEEKFSIQPLSDQQATRYKLDPSFFKKGTMVQNILIATSANVSDFTHREAAYQFDMVMKSIRPDIAQRIRDREVLCVLVGHKELTSDVPMFTSDKKGKELDFYNWRQRGFLTTKHGRPVVLFAEEDVLEYEGGMQLESILIHEFGHVIQGAGFDKELNDRVKAAFENAKQKGIYNDGYAAQKFRRVKSATPVSLLDALAKSFPDQTPEFLRRCLDGGDILVNGRPVRADAKVTKDDKVLIVFGGPKQCYALVNAAEYWAEGVQDWYDTNRTMDHDHNHIHTREQLKSYDPELAKLCAEVLGDSDWRFVSPRKRAGQGHLAGYNPATAPSVVKLEHIDQAAQDYYDKYWKDFWKRLHDKCKRRSKSALTMKHVSHYGRLNRHAGTGGWGQGGQAGDSPGDGDALEDPQEDPGAQVAADVVAQFEKRLEAIAGKAMVAWMNRRICVELYNTLVQLAEDLKATPLSVAMGLGAFSRADQPQIA